MALRFDDISINTVIGNGSTITGNLKVNGFVRIDGDIDGNLETDGNVIVGENARIRGSIKAKSVILGGIIIGDIHAEESVKLLSMSVIYGDIISHKVQIDENVLFHGHCISIKENDKYQAETTKYLQKKAIKDKVTL